MFIKQFREVTYRVPDPLRPGHTAFDRRMDSAGTHRINHNGQSYEADQDGWFDLPNDVAQHFLKFDGWCTPEMVDENIVAGRIRRDDADAFPNTRNEIEKKSKKGKSKAAASA